MKKLLNIVCIILMSLFSFSCCGNGGTCSTPGWGITSKNKTRASQIGITIPPDISAIGVQNED